MKFEFLGPKQKLLGGGWARTVRVDGADYRVSVTPGERVRIAFKPRGPGAYGYHWVGRVERVGGGMEPWHHPDVGKSAGAAGLLERALEHDFMRAAFGARYATTWYAYDVPYGSERGQRLRRMMEACGRFASTGGWEKRP